jgi:NADH-ubiquinone oxidoreductase chain 5
MWWYLGSTDYGILFANTSQAYYTDWICFTLLIGAMGKSAQIGLHVWLADAMEGPTPVSALIHAATLVTAGVYLIARTSPLWETSSTCRLILTIVGSITSLMAATCGFFQNDLKRVIAYSTCSQLGYMMVSCGLSHYSLAIYHLMTHACFKALLFLSAGVIIHAMSNVQDMRRQGGSQALLPIAWSAMVLGSLSLAGWPFLSGFYSKDAILELSWSSFQPASNYAYVILMIVACFTSYYSFRVLICAFVSPISARKTELPTPGLPIFMWFPLVLLSAGSIWVGYIFSDMLLGWGTNFWHHSVQLSTATGEWISSHFLPTSFLWLPFWSAWIGLALAISYAWPMPFFASSSLKIIYIFLQTRWQFDFVFNQQVVQRVLNWGADTWTIIDKGVLEVIGPKGLTNTLLNSAVPTVRLWQSGVVHDYALIYKVCVLLGLGLIFLPVDFNLTTINSLSARHIIIISFLLWEYQTERF